MYSVWVKGKNAFIENWALKEPNLLTPSQAICSQVKKKTLSSIHPYE